MRMTLGAIVLVLVATACSPGDGTDTTLPESTTSTIVRTGPVVGGVATVALDELPATVNPVAPGGTVPSSRLIQQGTLPGAYVLDPDTWVATPYLVARIPAGDDVVLDRDRQTVTWTIRDDAVWSDGTPVSGQDFAFTLRATLGLTECGVSPFADSVFGIEIVAVEAKSITVEMPGPTTTYATMFPAVLPSHAVDGAAVCAADGVGWPSAGPYIANEINGTSISIRRNDAFWGDSPAVGGVDFVELDDDAAADSFGSDDVELAVTSDPDLASAFERSGATVSAVGSGHVEHIAFNFAIGQSNEEDLLRSPLFREAVAAAVDRNTLADASGWLPAWGLLPGSAEPWATGSSGVEAATALLAEACESMRRDCTEDPPSLRLVSTAFGGRPAVVARVVADLEAVGIVVTPTVVASIDLEEELDTGKWDIAVLAFNGSAGLASIAEALQSVFASEGLGNVSTYGGSGSLVATDRSAFELRLALGQMAATPDLARTAELVADVHELLAENTVVVPLITQPRFTAVAADRLRGVVGNATPSGVTWNISEWSYTDE